MHLDQNASLSRARVKQKKRRVEKRKKGKCIINVMCVIYYVYAPRSERVAWDFTTGFGSLLLSSLLLDLIAPDAWAPSAINLFF
jgi:hypothetical protein